MTKRDVDPQFELNEKLWRRIEKRNVFAEGGGLKPSSLRFQISVDREKYGTPDDVCSGKFNGIAEVEACRAAAIIDGTLRFACVDDPGDGSPAHALIAVVQDPGGPAGKDIVDALRDRLAGEFSIIQEPRAVKKG